MLAKMILEYCINAQCGLLDDVSNSMTSEGLPPFISSSRGLSHIHMEGQKGSFLNSRRLSSDYSCCGSDPGNARSFHGTAQESKLAHVKSKIFRAKSYYPVQQQSPN